jgi:hypothetical protein
VRLDKESVCARMRAKGLYDRAQQAACTLPRVVDTDRDAGLLHLFEINVADLVGASSKE